MKFTTKPDLKTIRINLYSILAGLFEKLSTDFDKSSFIAAANQHNTLKNLVSKLSRRDLFIIIFNRAPERAWEINLANIINQRVTMDLLYEFLFSQENNALNEIVFANTFHEKGVDVFIHIPKTAGTTLNTILGDSAEVLACTHDVMSISSLYKNETDKSILLSGHRPLEFYKTHLHIANRRNIFTAIRDPIDLAISFFNFAITMSEDEESKWFTFYKDTVQEWKSSDTSTQKWFERYLESAFFELNVKDIFYKFLGSPLDAQNDTRAIFNNLLQHGVVLIKSNNINSYFGSSDKVNQLHTNTSTRYIQKHTLNFDTIYDLSKRLAAPIEFFTLLNNFSDWVNHGVLDFTKISSTKVKNK